MQPRVRVPVERSEVMVVGGNAGPGLVENVTAVGPPASPRMPNTQQNGPLPGPVPDRWATQSDELTFTNDNKRSFTYQVSNLRES